MDESNPPTTITVRLRLKQFEIPPITDALVLGRKAPIGSEAMRRALVLLHVHQFEHIDVEDDVIDNVIVRENVLNKIPKEKLIPLLLRRVKPIMTPEEVIHVDLDTEIFIEEQL